MVSEFFLALKQVYLNMENDRWMWIHARDYSYLVLCSYKTIIGVDHISNESA